MTKINLPRPLGRHSGLGMVLTNTARFLAAFVTLHAALAVVCTAQTRTDNRRLFWTGSAGATWDNSTASWMTTGSYLTYANSGATSAVWATSDAIASTQFLTGDTVVLDSTSDTAPTYDPGTGLITPGDSARTRVITIANAGVTASDVIVSGSGNFIFTGGGITADASSIAPGSVQLTGTGVGLAAPAVLPTGRLVKVGAGVLTLSNTVANKFAGGIYLGQGVLEIADARALGANNISVITTTATTGANADAHGQKKDANIAVPGTVLDAAGTIMRAGSQPFNSGGAAQNIPNSLATIRVPTSAAGLNITGNINLASQILTFEIEGDTTISGRIYGSSGNYGSSGGTFIKNGNGTLTITGTQNWFYGTRKNYNQINAGRVVVTNPYAIGTGATSIAPGSVLEFRGVVGTMRQAFIGAGSVEVTQGSDLTFNWRNGTLSDYDFMSGIGSWHPAKNELSTITVSGQSRFSAIASGTYSTVLGGPTAYVSITEGSTLVLGREGLSARGSGSTEIPMTYPILANRIDLSGASTVVLNPNAYLNIGALVVTDHTTCAITFGASGVSRLRWQEGINPDSIATDPNAATSIRYIIPNGMKLIINEIIVPSGFYREFVVVNQGANPLKDIAMTMNALDAIHDTISTRLADELIDPVTRHTPARGRKWLNEAWMRYITSEVDYDADSITTPGVTGRINGLVLGFDGILPNRILLGLHFGMAENNLDTTNDTTLSSKQRFLGLHAAQRFGKFYLAAAADTGRVRTDSVRNEPDSIVRGKWETSYYSASVEAGATFSPWQKTMLRPYAGLRYSKLKVNKHYEYGLSPLMIEDFTDTGSQAVFGIAVGRKFTLFKRDLALDLSIGRKHTIKAPRETLDTHYFDSPTTTVTLERGDYYSDVNAVGLSARMAVSRHTLVGITFDYETGSSHTRMTGSLLAGYTW